MHIDTDLTKNNCNFPHCRYYLNGKCLNDNRRKDCLEIALAVLCATDKTMYNNRCDFCTALLLADHMNQDRCNDYNKKDKVGRAKAHHAAKFMTYITDSHKRYYEKESRAFQLNYCPLCGRLLKGRKFYNGKETPR